MLPPCITINVVVTLPKRDLMADGGEGRCSSQEHGFTLPTLLACPSDSTAQQLDTHWGQERAALLNELGLHTAATWMPFQPNNPHEELVVSFSKPHRKFYQAEAERFFLVLSPLEHLDKGSGMTCLS